MRLVSEHDRVLQEVESAARLEKRRLQEQLTNSALEMEALKQEMSDSVARAKETSRRDHTRALQACSGPSQR